jgi:F1F0 ATPase subunit 2
MVTVSGLYTLGVTESVLVLAFGLGTGILHFGGLWFTLHRIWTVKRWGSWLMMSAVVRFSLLGAIFFLIARDNWQRLLPMTLGILLARFLVIHITKTMKIKRVSSVPS